MEFEIAKRLFDDDKIRELADSPKGLRFLKLRSLSRKSSLERLFREAKVTAKNTSAKGMFQEAFDRDSDISIGVLEQTIRLLYQEERAYRKSLEDDLVNELYKLKSFEWGGLHQNSLERTIIDNYVKKVTKYSVLSEKIENELFYSMRGYVFCSWYNHWTSILIEDVFRDHVKVLPAVGKIKKIDFFINDVPFDLKVTYLPEGFIKGCRKNKELRPELTLLKQAAGDCKFAFDKTLPDARLLEDLWAKLKDHPDEEAQKLISDLDNFRVRTLGKCREDPTSLIRWLYENQGVRRFDASNRLFLVLVDQTNFFDSWKLKRAKPLLVDSIVSYLDSQTSRPGIDLDFDWEGSQYSVRADVLFVVPPT